MTTTCEECGRPKKRIGRLCSRCYGRVYYHDPEKGAERRRLNNDRVARYAKANPDKRMKWARDRDIRAAIEAGKRLERERIRAAARENIGFGPFEERVLENILQGEDE